MAIFGSLFSKNTTQIPPAEDVRTQTTSEMDTASQGLTDESGLSQIIVDEHNTNSLTLKLELEHREEMTRPAGKKWCDNMWRAGEYGGYTGSLQFNRFRKYILGCQLLVMAISEWTKSGGLGKALDMRGDMIVQESLHQTEQEFAHVRYQAESSMKEYLEPDTLSEVFLETPANETLGPTNKFMERLNHELSQERQEQDRIRNETLAYLDDETESFSFIREELESGRSHIEGFSSSVDQAVTDVETALDEMQTFATENYDATYEEMEAYRASYESAVSRFTQLMNDISGRLQQTCSRLRSNNVGLRGWIVGNAVDACNAVESYINNNRNTDDSPNVSGGPGGEAYYQDLESQVSSADKSADIDTLRDNLTNVGDGQGYSLRNFIFRPHGDTAYQGILDVNWDVVNGEAVNIEIEVEGVGPVSEVNFSGPTKIIIGDGKLYEVYDEAEHFPLTTTDQYTQFIENMNDGITHDMLAGLRADAIILEEEVTKSFDNSLAELAIRESELERLQADLQNTTSAIPVPESGTFGAVTEIIEEVKAEHRTSTMGNQTEQQQIINDAISEIEQNMNQTMTEEILPLVENITQADIEEIVSEFEKTGKWPIAILELGRNVFLGLVALSVLHKVLEELKAPAVITWALGKVPGVKVRYKPSDEAGRRPAQVAAAKNMNQSHKGLKCKLTSEILKGAGKNLLRSDVLTTLGLWLAVSNMHRLDGLGAKAKDNWNAHSADFDRAMDKLNGNISNIIEGAYAAKDNTTIDHEALNQDIHQRLQQASQTRQDVASEMDYLQTLGVLDCYVDAGTGEAYISEGQNDTSYLDQFPKDSVVHLTIDDIYSDNQLNNTLRAAVDDHINEAKGEQEKEKKEQRNWTLGLLGVSVVASLGFEIGRYKDIYKLDEHGLAPEDWFTWKNEKKRVRNLMADLALKLNHYKFTVKGVNFCQAESGYMSGHKVDKKDNHHSEQKITDDQTSSITQESHSSSDIESGKLRVEFLSNETQSQAGKEKGLSKSNRQSPDSLFVEIGQEASSFDQEDDFEDIELGS